MTQEDMNPDCVSRQLIQQVVVCDDCDKNPLQGCINTWFPTWTYTLEHNPDHPSADRDGNVAVERWAKRCPQFAGKTVEPTQHRKRAGFVVVTGGKKK